MPPGPVPEPNGPVRICFDTNVGITTDLEIEVSAFEKAPGTPDAACECYYTLI